MTAPVFVLKPTSVGYREVKLPPGLRTIGRSSETGIKSQFVSRKHVEIIVEGHVCKVRYCAKHTSEVRIDASPVNKEWVECPVGARLELLSNPRESFPYTLELYRTASSAAAPESSGVQSSAVELRNQHQEMASRLHCPMCMELYVDPTELDCEGKHLFCHKCIFDLLSSDGCTNKCPVCTTKISGKRKSTILKSSNKRGRRDSAGPPAKRYQSQAVGLVQEMIEWMVERRMCEYGDESEWRKRSGLEPLPSPKAPKSVAPPETGGGGGSSEVINLLSDSEGEGDLF